ncbi:MAG: HAD-IA family hydrolase [Verrucomicrobiota bacterium]
MSDTKPLIIFDFDGTLANTIDTGIEIFNEIADQYNLSPVTREEADELRKLHIRALLDRLGLSRFAAVKLAAHIRKLIHSRMDEVDMFDGISDAVTGLHELGYPMGIISSNSTGNIKDFMKRFGLFECFGFIEAGVSLFGKPNRISSVLRKEKVQPLNAIYVGDETRDMEAARKVGVAGLAVCWGANKREAMMTEGPEFCIDSPEELIGCAEQWTANRAK